MSLGPLGFNDLRGPRGEGGSATLRSTPPLGTAMRPSAIRRKSSSMRHMATESPVCSPSAGAPSALATPPSSSR